MMRRHDIRIGGSAVRDMRIAGPVLAHILGTIVEGTTRVLRYRLEGRSKAPGSLPAWLRPAAGFDVISSLDPGIVQLEACSLADTLPERFRQGDLFQTVDPDKSALDLFEDGLEDALRGNHDSDLFDEGLVQTFAEFRQVLGEGLDRIEIMNGRTVPVSLDGLRRVEELRRSTPRPAHVRVAGRLDAIRYSDKMFTLVLESGVELRGVAAEVDEGSLKSLWGRPALVVGTAHFRPSGALARVDAERVEAASQRDLALWQAAPISSAGAGQEFRTLRQQQGRRSGINALVGQWPGDETEEELVAALEALS
jgi:hypothetical protein